MIAVLLLSTKTFFRDAARRLQTLPAASLGIGFLYFLVLPFAVVLLLVTVIGIPIGLLLLCTYIFSFVFVQSITAILLAKCLEASRHAQYHIGMLLLISLLAILLLHTLTLLPLGWLFTAVIECGAQGALLATAYERYQKVR